MAVKTWSRCPDFTDVKPLEAKVKSLETLEAKVQTLEDIEAIQKLQKAYGYYLEHMMVEDIVDLFAEGEDSELWVTAVKFKGKDARQGQSGRGRAIFDCYA